MQAHMYYVYAKDGRLLKEFVRACDAFDFFQTKDYAHTVYQGVDLIDIKDGE